MSSHDLLGLASPNLDPGSEVHSMMGMSAVALIIVGGSFMACTGLGAVFGALTSPLPGTITLTLNSGPGSDPDSTGSENPIN